MGRIVAMLEAPVESDAFAAAFASSTADELEDVLELSALAIELKNDELALLRLRAALDTWEDEP